MTDSEIVSWTVFGERKSGTNWTSRIMGQVTNCHDLSDSYVSGWKHGKWGEWQEKNLHDNNLVIFIEKDPFAWSLSLFRHPWHCHHMTVNGYSNFLREEFYSVIDGKWAQWFQKEPESEREGERFPNVIQMWKEKKESFSKIVGVPVIHISYESLLINPNVFLETIEKMGVKINGSLKDKPEDYKKFRYYTEREYMELISRKDEEFISGQLRF